MDAFELGTKATSCRPDRGSLLQDTVRSATRIPLPLLGLLSRAKKKSYLSDAATEIERDFCATDSLLIFFEPINVFHLHFCSSFKKYTTLQNFYEFSE